MALRNIFKEGDPVLRKISKKVDCVDEKIQLLIKDMFETMENGNGVGLAAPQVGILKRIFVVNTHEEGGIGPIAFVNPKIIKRKGSQICEEGCLSIPKVFGEVERPKEIVIEAMNEKGESFTMKVEDFLANVICHEYDHLDGILFRDKVIRYIEQDEKEVKSNRHKLEDKK